MVGREREREKKRKLALCCTSGYYFNANFTLTFTIKSSCVLPVDLEVNQSNSLSWPEMPQTIKKSNNTRHIDTVASYYNIKTVYIKTVYVKTVYVKTVYIKTGCNQMSSVVCVCV